MPGVDCGGRGELHDVSADDGMFESVSGGVRWRSWSDRRVNKFISHQKETKYRKRLCRGEEETLECQMYTLRLAVVARLLQNLRESDASRGPNQLLLALLPLALALMYVSSSLYLKRARNLCPRRHPLAGVHGPQHTLLPLLQAWHRAAMAEGLGARRGGMSPDSR